MKNGLFDRKFVTGCAAAAAVFALAAGVFLNGIGSFLSRTRLEGAKTLQAAVNRACVQCYAIEGRYPPSVEYLEEHYGIRIDEKRYAVFYNGFASNIMPEITVVLLDEP